MQILTNKKRPLFSKTCDIRPRVLLANFQSYEHDTTLNLFLAIVGDKISPVETENY